MDSLVMSFVNPITTARLSDDNPGKVCIIVPRTRAYLADLLLKSFEGREDVEIFVDRRYSDRRTQTRPATMERRWAERRLPKEEVIQVIVGRPEPESLRRSSA